MSSIEVHNFTYHHGDVELAGYIAQPSRYPKAGIMIVPTIAGPSDLMRDRARWLASIGYSAMVCDIYGKGFVDDMRKVFARVDVEPVTFHNVMTGESETNWLFLSYD